MAAAGSGTGHASGGITLAEGDRSMSINISGTCFTNSDGLKYFRKGAIEVYLGSAGEKKEPVLSANYLEVTLTANAEYLKSRVQKSKTVAIDWSRTTAGDIGATIPVFQLGTVFSPSLSYAQAKSFNGRLFFASLTTAQVKSLLNVDAVHARQCLKEEGADGRIVSGVWVVVHAALAESFDTAASFSAASVASVLKLTASGGMHGTQSITLEKGSVFAYRLSKVKDWDGDKVGEIEHDYSGLG
jgi:hypothetical protein